MRRRAFITLLGGAAATLPFAARAQQPERVRRVGALMGFAENDPEQQTRIAAFRQRLQELGWTEGRNILIDYRYADGDTERMRAQAAELLALAPDLIVATNNGVVEALRRITRSVPIVFAQVSDPVGSGLIASLARPGGNMTGFTNFEPEMGGKWLEVLKEIAPAMTRVAILAHPTAAPHVEFVRTAQTAAPILKVTLTTVQVRDAAEITRAVTTFAADSDGGLITLPHPVPITNRNIVIGLAAEHRLPAIYPYRFFAADGGLASYGIDQVDQWRGAATYVDRIFRGEKPGDLPVQQPTKYQQVLNLKTAKALGLAVPPMLLARTDEVIE